MAKYMKISLEKRGVSCVAQLLEEDAPRTCAAIWDALPQEGPVYHAKYARNEIYIIVPRFAQTEPGIENPTVTPIPGDLCYFSFPEGVLDRQFKEEKGVQHLPGVIDLALFYGRNNLLLNADIGWVVGNVFATIVEGLEDMAKAGNDIWRAGAIDERLTFARYENYEKQESRSR
jgi:hypothetical protein